MQTAPTPTAPPPIASSSDLVSSPPSSAMKRYADAYLVARTIAKIGGVVKIVALVIGGTIVLSGSLGAVTTFMSSSNTTVRHAGWNMDGTPRQAVQNSNVGLNVGMAIVAVIASWIVGAVVAIPLYILGILLASQGQILKATLDAAVHSSPFLKKEEMASVMAL